MEFHENQVTRVGVQHFHILVGPEEVNLYGVRGMTFPGPLFDVLVDDAEEAGVLWINVINSHIEGYFNEDDLDGIIDEVLEHAEDDEYQVAFEVEESGFMIGLHECWGCVPTHTN